MEQLDFQLDELKALDATEPGTFSGWASTYGERDGQNDVVQPGAFKKSLKERPRLPLLWQHVDPVGIVDPVDQAQGLAVRGKLVLTTQKGREAHELLKSGAVSGLSIGFRAVRHTYSGDARVLQEVALHEISLVAVPALDSARVTSVKTHADGRIRQGGGSGYPSRALEQKTLELQDLLQERLSHARAGLFKVGLDSEIASVRHEIELLAGAEPVEAKQQPGDIHDRLRELVARLK